MHRIESEETPSINVRLKTSGKGFAMKINIGQFFLDTLLFIRLCLPATVFIGLCTGIFIAFIAFLSTFSQIYPLLLYGAWPSLLIFYIIFGVAFTLFAAHLIHTSFGSEELRVQRHMASLSGLPFYVLCLLSIACTLYPVPGMDAANEFMSVLGFFGFGLVSFSYLILIRFFLQRFAKSLNP